MSAKIDPRDIAMLRKMSDTEWEFTKGGAQERRAYDLASRGLAEKKMTAYKMNYATGQAEFRNAYRRTEAGKAAVAAADAN